MLDVSALLDDTAFCTPFTVLRLTESVNDHGRAEYAEASMPMTGVVQPATARELDRLPEGDEGPLWLGDLHRVRLPGLVQPDPDRASGRMDRYREG